MSDNVKDEPKGEIGNQQERLFGWLAGIIDGEGTISIQMYRKPDGRIRLIPIIGIVNTHQETLALCLKLIHQLTGGSGHQARFLNKKSHRKQCYQIRVDGYPSVESVLRKLTPYLVTKRDKAETVLRFIELRKANRLKRNSKGQLERLGYSQEELDLVLLTRVTEKHRIKSSETIRQALNKR